MQIIDRRDPALKQRLHLSGSGHYEENTEMELGGAPRFVSDLESLKQRLYKYLQA